jgi:hypothetical protein
MSLQDTIDRRTDAAAEFDGKQADGQGTKVANSLSHGLSALRTALFKRIHEDVERYYGADSMLSPFSAKSLHKMETNTMVEIEIYQVAVSCEEVRDRSYVADLEWYRDWLSRLRLGELAARPQVKGRLDHYLEEARGERRLEFSGILARTAPEAARAPLVLYRLFPFSVRIATNLAFGDHLSASELRNRQVAMLPHIADCRTCHGRPFENGDRCEACGNPVWKFNWLRSVD